MPSREVTWEYFPRCGTSPRACPQRQTSAALIARGPGRRQPRGPALVPCDWRLWGLHRYPERRHVEPAGPDHRSTGSERSSPPIRAGSILGQDDGCDTATPREVEDRQSSRSTSFTVLSCREQRFSRSFHIGPLASPRSGQEKQMPVSWSLPGSNDTRGLRRGGHWYRRSPGRSLSHHQIFQKKLSTFRKST